MNILFYSAGIVYLSVPIINDSPDDLKLRSSMTLFSLVPASDPVFDAGLKKFFDGKRDTTLETHKKLRPKHIRGMWVCASRWWSMYFKTFCG
jgi:hypothetical protein